MAMTMHAIDVRKAISRVTDKHAGFDHIVLALRSLFTMRDLGLKTRRWAAKKLEWLQTDPQWLSQDPVEQARRFQLLDMLIEKNELAIKKYETRLANKKTKEQKAATPAAPEGANPAWDL